MIKRFENYSNGLDAISNDNYWAERGELTKFSKTEEEIIRNVFSKYNVCSLEKVPYSHTFLHSNMTYDYLDLIRCILLKILMEKL